MCRFVAYIGEPLAASTLVLDPPHSLLQQCSAPRHQTRTNDNRDGFGLAWFGDGGPQRYRQPISMADDAAFGDVARAAVSTSFVGAIRKATPGLAIGVENTPPYVRDGLIFAHNGEVNGWLDGNDAKVRAMVLPARVAEIEGTTDSEVLFAAILTVMDEGASLARAVQEIIGIVSFQFGGWLNVVVADGERLVATSFGNSLFVAERPDGIVLASEPYDDDAAWVQVEDRSFVEVSSSAVEISPLPMVIVTP